MLVVIIKKIIHVINTIATGVIKQTASKINNNNNNNSINFTTIRLV